MSNEPIISVIIPVGPGHTHASLTALQSVNRQTFKEWEIILVDDTGGEWAPWINDGIFSKGRALTTSGRTGAAHARNIGLEAARAPLVTFLDADDYLTPTALEAFVQGYAQSNAGYVYGDWWADDGREHGYWSTPFYDRIKSLESAQHVVTTCMATEDARRLGGFDETVEGWEDFDFYCKAAVAGICGAHLSHPVMVYRLDKGQRRNENWANKEELVRAHAARYHDYTTGVKAMAGCSGCNAAAAQRAAAATSGRFVTATTRVGSGPDAASGLQRMKFIGEQRGAVSYRNPDNGHIYRGGNNAVDMYVDAQPEDADWLESLSVWQRVVLPPVDTSFPEAPTPDEVNALSAAGLAGAKAGAELKERLTADALTPDVKTDSLKPASKK